MKQTSHITKNKPRKTKRQIRDLSLLY
uniref:Uncharacterized protein n=1 Tax=Arundo donax TaxID=35708 RepID=A0A0A9B463_ARUDO